MSETPDPAKARFFALAMVRLSGAALAVFGLAIIGGRIAASYKLGIGLFALGLFEVLFFPALLASRWKSK